MRRSLTILTTSFKSEALILRNIQLVEELNPQASVEWLVVNNEERELTELSSYQSTNSRVRVLPGSPSFKTPWDEGSYHHALALMLALPQVKSSHLLILDPDFFICRPNWIEEVLGRMSSQSLAFFCATWNPAIPSKYPNFPCVHCLFVDLEKVPKALLDVSPDLPMTFRRRKFADSLTHWKLSIPKILRRRLWPFELAQFWMLRGQARDTGYRIYEIFHGNPNYPSEQLEFLVRFEHIDLTTKFLMYFPFPIRWWIKKKAWVPDPAKVGKKSFLKPKVGKIYYRLGWDEFLWKGEPFGFHFRRVARAHRPVNPAKYGDEGGELALLGKVLDRTGISDATL